MIKENIKNNMRQMERLAIKIEVDENLMIVNPLDDGKWKVICKSNNDVCAVYTMNDKEAEEIMYAMINASGRDFYYSRFADTAGYCLGTHYRAIEPLETKRTIFGAIRDFLLCR